MQTHQDLNVGKINTLQIVAAVIIGSIAVLIAGLQPILLGELANSGNVSMEGVGLVAMAEIIAIGIGVVIGNALLPLQHLRRSIVVASVMTASLDAATIFCMGDSGLTTVRAAAGLSEGLLIWGITNVIVRSENPSRIGGLYFIAQTAAQATVAAVLASAVIPLAGWRGGFILLACLSLIPCALVRMLPTHMFPLERDPASSFFWSRLEASALIVVFLQLAAIGSFWAYLEALGHAIGFASKDAQSVVSMSLFMQLLGCCAATWAVRFVRDVLMLLSGTLVIGAAGFVVYCLVPGSSVQFVLACGTFGFAAIFLLPFQISLAFRVDPTGRVAMVVPALQLLGSAFGPLVASLSVHGDNVGSVPLISAGFAVAALAFLPNDRVRSRVGGTST
ncbi:MFS transporter [Variovorax sp. AFSI2.2]|uniref:MFS transporter n=1 Tax=Variovorax sp. AFSI2.2 TaxID=3384160 RepID=UPI003EBEADEC